MNQYLENLVNETQQSVIALKDEISMVVDHPLKNKCVSHRPSLKEALMAPGFHVIAEIKRQSPSKGKLAPIDSPVILAQEYEQGGACAISVLTNKHGFGGDVEDLVAVAKCTNLPILRKEFIIDPIQIVEAAHHGASAVLLIVAITKNKTKALLEVCKQHHIDAIVEVHTKEELDLALEIGAKIIGVNNRNLNTFEVDPIVALELAQHIPSSVISIAESGIKDVAQAMAYKDAGYNAVLIGEALVTSQNPSQLIQDIVK